MSLERICAEAIMRRKPAIDAALTDPLSKLHHERLDHLLNRKEGSR
ncbi:MAG: hypothetical protein JJE04_23875 [Acidobacteriia bacterium]|nr:hypothetical protein [Terriglobia bacterium]